ncbi:MAG: insulinase family protein, partial [Candidatus Goldbacteria bacterium]|nr:insulinase family protein [Candidatus Goldiibacteriota bacterium]
ELGGYNNAFTSYDATNYVIVVPSENIEKVIEIQFDALTASVFDETEINKEREVIIDELKRGQDNPDIFIMQKLFNMSFDAYYKDPIIGYEENLRKYNRNSIVDFFKKYYIPDNMVIVISGDVNPEKIIKVIKNTFGTLPGRKTSEIFYSSKKDKNISFKYNTFSGEIESRYLMIGFPIPDILSDDTPAIEILARLMGGFESSRLYQKLKEEKEFVDNIDMDIFTGKFGGILIISGIIREGKYTDVLGEIFKEIEKIKKYGVTQEELNRVKSDILREKEKELMKVENDAFNLGFFEILSDYKEYYKYYDRLRRVLETDILNVASKYLDSDAASIVLYYPKKKEKEFKNYKEPEKIKSLIMPSTEKKEMKKTEVQLIEMKNGMKLIHKKQTNTNIVAAKFLFPGGVIYEGSFYNGLYKGITNLMIETMMKGTKKRSAKDIAKRIDELGAVFIPGVSKEYFSWSMEVMNTNFENLIELFSDIIFNPSFEIEEIRKEKEDIINKLSRLKDRPEEYAFKLFNEEFFEWHPYGYYPLGTTYSVKVIPARFLKEWHDKFFVPDNLIVSVVGNVDIDYVKDILEKYLNKWEKSQKIKINLPVKISYSQKTKREKIEKNQSHIIIGFKGPKTNSDDYFTFRVLDTILSGGMDSRLFYEIRDKKNLCYNIFSTFDRFIENGAFKIYAATSPENEEKLEEEIFNVLKDLVKNKVTTKEIKAAKNYINGMYKFGFQDYMAQADSYCMYEFWGLGYKQVDKFLDRINAVKKDDIERIIDKYINLDECTKVILSSKKNEKEEK